jgi:ABC-type uncharacterized transport system auxiliary subunit
MLLGAALAASACSGSFFHSSAPAPTTYLLSVKAGASGAAAPAAGTSGVADSADARAAAAAPGAAIPADLTVLMPRVRTGLLTDHIAALYADRRLDSFAAARWSGPLDEVMQDLLLQAFRTLGGYRNVHTDMSAFAAGYWLEIDVVDFQAEYSADGGPPTAHVRLLGRVGTARDRVVLGEFEADAHQAAAADRLGAIVDAYNGAADSALATIVADTTASLRANLARISP